jgi:hypothetical protein
VIPDQVQGCQLKGASAANNETQWDFVKPSTFHRKATVETNNQIGVESWNFVRTHFAGYGKDKRSM